MTTMTPDTLSRLATEALERTAFVLCDACESADGLAPADRYVQISYAGSAAGVVVLGASDGFLTELASSILGDEPEDIDVETTGVEALREMANVICGSVVFELGGSDNSMSLGLPEAIDADDVPTTGVTHRVWLDSDGEQLEVVWFSNTGSAAQAA